MHLLTCPFSNVRLCNLYLYSYKGCLSLCKFYSPFSVPNSYFLQYFIHFLSVNANKGYKTITFLVCRFSISPWTKRIKIYRLYLVLEIVCMKIYLAAFVFFVGYSISNVRFALSILQNCFTLDAALWQHQLLNWFRSKSKK